MRKMETIKVVGTADLVLVEENGNKSVMYNSIGCTFTFVTVDNNGVVNVDSDKLEILLKDLSRELKNTDVTFDDICKAGEAEGIYFGEVETVADVDILFARKNNSIILFVEFAGTLTEALRIDDLFNIKANAFLLSCVLEKMIIGSLRSNFAEAV